MAEISNHGYERSRERFKLNAKSTMKLAQRALEVGVSHKEATGSLRKYFDRLFLAYMKGNNIRIYAEKVFIFEGNFLITVYQLPNEFKRLVKKTLEKRENVH